MDEFDKLIYEKGLRIKTLYIDKELDLLVIILNNANLIKTKISLFKLLKDASMEDLNGWSLRAKGVGVRWEKLDEDLSLKGFIQDATMHATLQNLQSNQQPKTVVM